jgi:polysaccharide biosynthesis protein PelF
MTAAPPPVTDVCLILEGTYPYVRGGVSAWVHNLITGLPELSFSLLSISADRQSAAERKYALPANVKAFAEVYVHELIDDPGRRCPARERRAAWDTMRAFHDRHGEERRKLAPALLSACAVPDRQALSVRDAFFSSDAWEMVLERYRARAAGTSFIDYFWTWRAVHAPLFQTLIAEIPPARVYHTISTGYAGLLGVVGKLRTGRPLLVTEHGIYVRERAIDIARADWIYEEPVRVKVARGPQSPLKEMWVRFFVTLGEVAYDAADLMISLFEGNARLQRDLGADPARQRVVPNGIETAPYAALRASRAPEGSRPLRIGFVGRVVPIKDVKTLLKAYAIVRRERPDVELWVIGPTDEDAAYHQECESLSRSLGLDKLRFLGSQDMKAMYPEIDVMALTSISEGQPLSILEAAGAGVPTVASDVGACRELIEGSGDADRALGPSGIVTGVGNPEETARGLLQILGDPAQRERMRRAGAERVETYYRQETVLDTYRALYHAYRELP